MKNCPFVSVILPIRNEEGSIDENINAILSQDYPLEQMEIIIVDGKSTDNTWQKIINYQNEYANVHIFENDKKIVPTGLNIAIKNSRGEIVIRVDGHTIIALDYVSQCVKVLQESRAENVGGCMTSMGKNLFGQAVALATSSPFGIGNSQFHFSDTEKWVDSVYLGAWPRIVFQKVGLFDEEMVRDQDDEFNYRLRENGGRIFLSPRIKSVYTVRSTPRALWKQYFEYGYWKVRVFQKHPSQMSLRHYIPATLVLGLAITIILAGAFSWGWALFLLIAGSYVLANLISSIKLASQNQSNILPKLFLAFSILHFAYGFGFLSGLLKFWNRWGDKKGSVPDLVKNE